MREKITELGEVVATFQGHRLRRGGIWWILFGWLSWLALIAYTAWLFHNLQVHSGLVLALTLVQPFVMVAYLLFLFLTSIAIFRFWSRKRFVAIYSHGLRWRLKGFRIQQLSWAELEGIGCATTNRTFFVKTVRTEHQAVLYRKDLAPVILDDRINGFAGLIETLKAQYYPTILPELMKSFENGQRLEFGPIAIQKTCIYVAKVIPSDDFQNNVVQVKSMQALPWSELSGLTVNSGFLMVKSGNSKMRKIPVSQIPNFEVLLKIVEQGVTL